MESSNEVFRLHHGQKYFWRTKHLLDIDIFEHKDLNVLEICVYDPSLGMEAPRFYLDTFKIVASLDLDAIATDVKKSKELDLRRHVTPDEAKIMTNALIKAKVNLILSHTIIVQYDALAKIIVAGFEFTTSNFNLEELTNNESWEGSCGANQFVCAKPLALLPSTMEYSCPFM